MSDLQHLASVNTVPAFKDDGKLYSRLANLRKPVRKHITYGGHRIVEGLGHPLRSFHDAAGDIQKKRR